jgi:hypothetical protein
MAALITAADLGIDTTTDQGLFDWLLASPAGAHRRHAGGNQPAAAALQGRRAKTAEIFLREVPDAVIGTA